MSEGIGEIQGVEFEKVDTVAVLERVFNELPMPYKMYATLPDMLMVIGGLKAGTDITFLGETYKEDEFIKFKEAFEKVRLKFTDLTMDMTVDKTPVRQGFIYDPKALREQTRSTHLVLPYDGVEPLESWMSRCAEAGKNKDAVIGKLYSFPESAIEDFLRGKPRIMSLSRKKHTISSGNETYWFFGKPKQDVLDHEERKKMFFEKLAKDQRFDKLMSSQSLKESNTEWAKRLPKESGLS